MIKSVFNFLFRKGIKVPFIIILLPVFVIIFAFIAGTIIELYLEIKKSIYRPPKFASERTYTVKNYSSQAMDFHRLWDGGYLIVGFLEINDDYDIYLIRTDSHGDTVWTKRIGNKGEEEGISIALSPDSCFMIIGEKEMRSLYIIKVNKNGDILYSKVFNDSIYWEPIKIIRAAKTNEYLIVADIMIRFKTRRQCLLQIDESGEVRWMKRHKLGIYPRGCWKSFKDEYIIYGWIPGGFLKIDREGSLIWSRKFGGRDTVVSITDVVQTSSSEYIAVGDIRVRKTGSDEDILILKFDDDGNILWSKSVGDSTDNTASAIVKHPSEGYMVIGSSGGRERIYLLRLNEKGDVLWSKIVGPGAPVGGMITEENEIVIIGTTTTYGRGLYSVYFVRTDTLGNIIDK